MFSTNELRLIQSLKANYNVLIANGHDIRLRSSLTGHEWIVISPYDDSACEILHRHSQRNPFHHQRGRFLSLQLALEYIREHDNWYAQRNCTVFQK